MLLIWLPYSLGYWGFLRMAHITSLIIIAMLAAPCPIYFLLAIETAIFLLLK